MLWRLQDTKRPTEHDDVRAGLRTATSLYVTVDSYRSDASAPTEIGKKSATVALASDISLENPFVHVGLECASPPGQSFDADDFVVEVE